MLVLLVVLWLLRLFTDYPVSNQYGQPGIRPRGGGPIRFMQRVTTLVKLVGNGGDGLANWIAARVAAGAAMRPDLVQQFAAYWPLTDETKEKGKEITDALAEASAASEGRNRGDGWHETLRRVNLGHEFTPLTEELVQCVKEYRALLEAAGLVPDPRYVERTGVLPSIGVAGSFDFLARKNGEGPLIVCDLKTGKRYAPKEAAQLACYSRFESLYCWETEEHEDMPPVNQRIGLIIHMPVDGKASLQVVNIEAGWEAVKVAVWMRDYLKRKDLTRPAQF